MINQTCKLTLKGITYETRAVNIGILLDIDKLRIELSGGRYRDMIMTGTIGMNTSLSYIDMMAALIAFMPKDFFDNLKLPSRNLSELHPSDAKELLEAYNEQMKPWILEVSKLLNGE